MMKLTIDRATWLRGEGGSNSRLLRGDDQKMCCLGFYAKSCGFSDEDLSDHLDPSELLAVRLTEENDANRIPQSLTPLVAAYHLPTSLAYAMMKMNDDPNWEEAYREARLKELFEQMDVEVEFVG
jgi:hypothetical protein